MRKQLLTKMLLIAASLFMGTSAWAYDVPSGYEIKTVYIGTNNGDGTVTVDAAPSTTGWSATTTLAAAATSGTLSAGSVTEVAKPDITITSATSILGDAVESGVIPTYVAGSTLQFDYTLSSDASTKAFATYTFSDAITEGKLVMSADFFQNGSVNNRPTVLNFLDSDGTIVLSMYLKDSSSYQYFQYYYNGATTADNNPYARSQMRTYRGFGLYDICIDVETGDVSFIIDCISRGNASGNDDRTRLKKTLSITSIKDIKYVQVGTTNYPNGKYTLHIDNVALYTVGAAASSHSYTINAKAGETVIKQLAAGYLSEGEEYSLCVPRVIEKDGEFYVWDEAESASSYKKTYTVGSTDETREVSYTKNTNIVAYIEGETTAGTNESYSSGAAGVIGGGSHLTAGRAFGTHAAGVYKFTVFVTGNDFRGIAVRNNAVDNSSNEYTQVRSEGTGKKEKTFILPEERTLIVTGHYTNGTKTNQSGDFDYAILEYVEDLPANEKIVVTSAGYATYVSNYNLDFTSATTKAYKVNVASKGVATLTEVAKVPAKTPVLLYVAGGNGEGENIAVTTDAVDAVTGNDLVAGSGATVATTDGDYTNMILNNVGGKVGFYFAAEQTVAANRAYLHIATTLAPDAGAGSRMSMVFDGETTGVDATLVNSEKVNSEVYDLQGRRVAQPTKGLYIVNGKKVIIK